MRSGKTMTIPFRLRRIGVLASGIWRGAPSAAESYYLAELYRLAGVLSARLAVQAEADARAWIERAITLARQQGATLLERKALASLGT